MRLLGISGVFHQIFIELLYDSDTYRCKGVVMYKKFLVSTAVTIMFVGCGGGSSGSSPSQSARSYTGTFIDGPVDGLEYRGNQGSTGVTSNGGHFRFKDGEVITFKIGNVIIGDAAVSHNDPIVTPMKIVSFHENKDVSLYDKKVIGIAQFLLSADTDGDPSTITIDRNITNRLADKPPLRLDSQEVNTTVVANYLGKDKTLVKDSGEAIAHLEQVQLQIADGQWKNTNETSSVNAANNDGDKQAAHHNASQESDMTQTNSDSTHVSSTVDTQHKSEEDSHIGSNTETNTNNGPGNTNGNNGSGTNPATGAISNGYRLLAWNDLGMHCMDGKDFSVFSILPPYNNLVAQLIKKGNHPQHIATGVTITYEATPSLAGKWNTTSAPKTNFWNYVQSLFGVTLPPDKGLAGNYVQSKTPHPLHYDATHKWWIAEGIPTMPYNDDGSYNTYPLVKVVAKDSAGNVLAQTITVLPVSDEMDCKKCHSSTSGYTDARPANGWVNMSDPEKDFKFNILRLHDEKHPNAVRDHKSSLQAKGWQYDPQGLEATARGGTPILCASCHKSNALPGTGVDNIIPLTRAIHAKHAQAIDPVTGLTLNDSTNRNACYSCHPGATTKCLRGAMGSAKNADGTYKIQCQSCHGVMSAVGSSTRQGWLDEPNCQSCHQNGMRYTQAVTDLLRGTLRTAVDHRFATTPDVPVAGKSLYRYSHGHGNMQCSACHGSPHAIYPTAKPEDNIQSIGAQGHAGTIGECTACHTTVPFTSDGGPHGMHTIGQAWVNGHGDIAEHNGATSCTACHGSGYRGSALSKTMSARTFQTKWGTKTFPAGHQVSCYDCHNGPGGGD